MTDATGIDGMRELLATKGEEALGKLVTDLLENPLVNGALTAALDARERAAVAQEVAMSAFNIPSASDIERLTRRVRSVGQRLEAIEDNLDRAGKPEAFEERLAAIEKRVAELADAIKKPAAPRATAATKRSKPAAQTKPAPAKRPTSS